MGPLAGTTCPNPGTRASEAVAAAATTTPAAFSFQTRAVGFSGSQDPGLRSAWVPALGPARPALAVCSEYCWVLLPRTGCLLVPFIHVLRRNAV